MIVRVIGSLVALGALAACQKVLSDNRLRPLATLAGTEWGPMNEHASDRFVAFKTDGDVVGSGGCNDFFGNFSQNGRLVTFGPLASTKKACAPDVMSAERAWLDLLAGVRAADANWKELTLYGEDGEVLTVLRRRDWD